MTYNNLMLNHHIQKSIVYRLALASPLRFSDLKPPELENKLFNYHLKIVMRLGLVVKNPKGLYILTAEGKKLGVHVYSEASNIFNRARSELLLAVRNNTGWLMYRRKNEPLKNLVGFMHCEPEAGVELSDKARSHLASTCSLDANFRVAGSGIVSTYLTGEIESYINFAVMLADKYSGTLKTNDPYADYFFVDESGLSKYQLLPNMPEILDAISANELFFLDKTYRF